MSGKKNPINKTKMEKITLELNEEEAKIYRNLTKNFNREDYSKEELNKRIFMRGMLESSEIIKTIIGKRDKTPTIVFTKPTHDTLDGLFGG